MGSVAQAWLAAVETLGGDPNSALSSAAELEQAYQDPARSYHCTSHIDQVVRDIGVLARDVGLGGVDRAIAVAAGCAHDVVYDGNPGADERASAEWARRAMRTADVPDQPAERVAELILATANHQSAPGDPVAAVLMDADLAILAGRPAAYADYVAAVRREYPHVSEPGWVEGRSAVLRSLLDMPRLYATAPARAWWEGLARTNLTTELAGLESSRR